MLSNPKRGEKDESEERAIELLKTLQRSCCALYIGAARDARSEVFTNSLQAVLSRKFQESFRLEGQGRPRKEVSTIQQNIQNLKAHGENSAQSLWTEAKEHLQGVFSPLARFYLDIDAGQMADFLVKNVVPLFSFGEHDAEYVPVEQLGAGTQSVLTMALTQLSMNEAENRLLLLEEPEAFLHPSAQRTLAWQLFGYSGSTADVQMIATTHSSLVLAEASPDEIVVLRNHVIHPAQEVNDLQNEKDRYHLSGSAAGAMFDHSLLLVEGPGDVAFFETLRRKLEEVIPVTILSRMRVCDVGGKQSFGPWLRLLRRYRDPISGSLAYNILVCADSIDAGKDIAKAYRDSVGAMPIELKESIDNILRGVETKVISRKEAKDIAARTSQANSISRQKSLSIHFMPVDLEYAMTACLNKDRACELASKIGVKDVDTAASLAAKLGSKGSGLPASNSSGTKAPYIRAVIADFLEWHEIPADLKNLLWRWIEAACTNNSLPRPLELS